MSDPKIAAFSNIFDISIAIQPEPVPRSSTFSKFEKLFLI